MKGGSRSSDGSGARRVTMSNKIVPIPQDVEHTWKMEVAPGFFRASSPRFGTLTFGLRPEGPSAVGWAWKEIGGGGVNIVPYVVIEGLLYIGMIYEKRPMLPTGWGWNIPRGFLEPGSTPLQSARKEWEEEVGSSAERLQQLKGSPQNPNSTFFDISDGSGTQVFGFFTKPEEVEQDDLVLIPDLGNAPAPSFVFVGNRFTPTSKMGEKILACRFFPWWVAATGEDANSSSGFARLLANHRELAKFLDQ